MSCYCSCSIGRSCASNVHTTPIYNSFSYLSVLNLELSYPFSPIQSPEKSDTIPVTLLSFFRQQFPESAIITVVLSTWANAVILSNLASKPVNENRYIWVDVQYQYFGNSILSRNSGKICWFICLVDFLLPWFTGYSNWALSLFYRAIQ